MIHLPANVRVYLCLSAWDMRKASMACMRWCGIIWNWMPMPAALLCRGCAFTGLADLVIIDVILFPSRILRFPFCLPLLPQCRKQSQLLLRLP